LWYSAYTYPLNLLSLAARDCPNLDHLHEGVVDARAVWQPEAASRADVVEKEELLLLRARSRSVSQDRRRATHLADLAMIPFGGLLHKLLVLLHALLVGEGDAVDALERLVVAVAEEVGRRGLCGGQTMCLTKREGDGAP
jgi:hypothetical protein